MNSPNSLILVVISLISNELLECLTQDGVDVGRVDDVLVLSEVERRLHGRVDVTCRKNEEGKYIVLTED